jgi:GT2 family glycosyltransferase
VRASVSVIVPFLGDEAAARDLLARLEGIAVGPADELIVADNTSEAVVAPGPDSPVRVVRAPDRRSAAHARNRAAATAAGEWLLFLDADCVVPPRLLDDYLEPPPDERCAIVAGEISGDPAQSHPLARWARSRRGGWVAGQAESGLRPAGVTANMLVRRRAFEQAGGFRLGGGADFDLSWRLQDAGWELEQRPSAAVLHRDRESLRELGAQARAYGSDRTNLRRTHGSAVPRPALVPAARSLAAAAVWLARREPERSRFALLDAFYFANAWLGSLVGGPRHRSAD